MTKRCTRCGIRKETATDFRWQQSIGAYHSWCRECERAHRQSRPRATRTTSRGRGRAFGVEVELTGPSQSIIVDALTAIGINVRTRGYCATNGSQWELKHDGSVQGHGLELVSPKLYGTAGLQELENVLAAINSVGATVNRSCGIHVHVDFRNRTVEQIKAAVLPLVKAQDTLYAMCAPSRRSNTYVPRWSDRAIAELENVTSLSYVHYAGPRGVVNMQSYTRHGSVEFRSHGGSTNAKKITAWVRMLLAAVECGEAGRTFLTTSVRAFCGSLNLSADDTNVLCRFEDAAQALETAEYAGRA